MTTFYETANYGQLSKNADVNEGQIRFFHNLVKHMSSRLRKKNKIKHRSHPIPISELVVRSFKDLGFELEDYEVVFHKSKPRLKVDFVLSRGNRQYAVELKSSRQMHLSFMHLFPRAILRLQAVNRVADLLSIVAAVVDRLESRDIRRLEEYMNLYAPNMGWLLLDRQRRGVFNDQEKNQYALLNEDQIEWVKSRFDDYQFSEVQKVWLHKNAKGLDDPEYYKSSAGSSLSSSSYLSSSILSSYTNSILSSSKIKLSFSDLDQWLIKVLLLSPLDIAHQFWGGPKGYAENAFQLSKQAGVSQMPANLWAQAMESSGYLKRIGRKNMIPLRIEALIEEWIGRYRFRDNRIYPFRSMFRVSNYDAFIGELFKEIRLNSEELGELVITAHLACKLHEVKHSSAKSIHIYCRGDIHNVARILKLVPSEEERKADLFLVEPKYPKSVFGGVLKKKEIPVCDILQCYLDLYYLPDRGREQAAIIYENIVSRIIRSRYGSSEYAL